MYSVSSITVNKKIGSKNKSDIIGTIKGIKNIVSDQYKAIVYIDWREYNYSLGFIKILSTSEYYMGDLIQLLNNGSFYFIRSVDNDIICKNKK